MAKAKYTPDEPKTGFWDWFKKDQEVDMPEAKKPLESNEEKDLGIAGEIRRRPLAD